MTIGKVQDSYDFSDYSESRAGTRQAARLNHGIAEKGKSRRPRDYQYHDSIEIHGSKFLLGAQDLNQNNKLNVTKNPSYIKNVGDEIMNRFNRHQKKNKILQRMGDSMLKQYRDYSPSIVNGISPSNQYQSHFHQTHNPNSGNRSPFRGNSLREEGHSSNEVNSGQYYQILNEPSSSAMYNQYHLQNRNSGEPHSSN